MKRIVPALVFPVLGLFAWATLSQPTLAQRGAQNGDWRFYGGDAGSTKYSPLDRINAANADATVVSIQSDAGANQTITLASGVATSLRQAAELVREATGSESEIQTRAGELAEGEDISYPVAPTALELGFRSRPLAEGIASYVAWIQPHPAAQGRARA